MEHLRGMALFAAVVEAGSFTAAAERLGVTKSAVSKQIQLLEQRHGVRLLERTTRSMALTEPGERFYQSCRKLVDLADAATDELVAHQTNPRGRLRISVPLGLADPFLSAPLAAFLTHHPQLEVDVQVNDAIVDLVGDAFDLAIRAGRLRDSSLIARRIAPLALILCASPKLLETGARPRAPASLQRFEFLAYAGLGSPTRLRLTRRGKRAEVSLKSRRVTNSGPVLRRLLLEGLGIGILPRFFVAEDLAAGRLEVVLPQWKLSGGGIHAVRPAGQYVPPKVRLFIDHLVGWHSERAPLARTARAGDAHAVD